MSIVRTVGQKKRALSPRRSPARGFGAAAGGRLCRALERQPAYLAHQLRWARAGDRGGPGLLGGARLLTLTGGCGKASFATRVAASLAEGYPDGVWLVELASLSDDSLMSQQVASALGV